MQQTNDTMHIQLLPRQGVHRNLKSPRAKKKVFQYVSKRQKTESGAEKAALVKELTSLKSDGGVLDGGDHKDTYNCKLLQKITKKEQKKEDAKLAEKIKATKKWLGIQKMIATKENKKGGPSWNPVPQQAPAANQAALEFNVSCSPQP